MYNNIIRYTSILTFNNILNDTYRDLKDIELFTLTFP